MPQRFYEVCLTIQCNATAYPHPLRVTGISTPNAPHFGGLWKAEGGCSVRKNITDKSHGQHLLSLEEFLEFTTIFTRIESILNSRPLTAASSDHSDDECLTPGHFRIGQPLLSIPESDNAVIGARVSLTNRWKLLHHVTPITEYSFNV